MWFVCHICPQPNTDCLTILLSQNNLSKSSLQGNSRPKSANLDVSNELQRTIWWIFTPIQVTHNNHSRLEQMKVNRGVNLLRRHIFNLNGFAWRCARTFERQYGIWSIHFFNDCSRRIYFCCFHLAAHKHTSMTSHTILSNFFEKQWTKNHLQYLSGLPRALFLKTFLKKAVWPQTTTINLMSLRRDERLHRNISIPQADL